MWTTFWDVGLGAGYGANTAAVRAVTGRHHSGDYQNGIWDAIGDDRVGAGSGRAIGGGGPEERPESFLEREKELSYMK